MSLCGAALPGQRIPADEFEALTCGVWRTRGALSEVWSGVRMTAACPVLRPSRRSLLLSGALLGTLGLAGCDGVSLPWSTPRATVTLAPMTTAAELQPEMPVYREDWGISPSSERPMAMLVHRERALEADLWAVTFEEPEGLAVPIDPLTTGLVVDGHGETVRVFASRVVDAARRTVMHTSTDLVEWGSVDVDGGIGAALVAAGDGLVATSQRDGELQVWDVSDDGAATALTPVPVPEGQKWSVQAVGRADDAVLVAIDRKGTSEEAAVVVSSSDGGVTWSAPTPLPGDADQKSVHAIFAQDGAFVLVGSWRTAVDWDEHTRTSRAAAWTGAGAEGLHAEEVPLPRWGLENFHQHDGRGELDPDTPIDFTDLSAGRPVRSPDGSEISVPTWWGDDMRMLRRDADGTWSAGEPKEYVPAYVLEAVGDATGTIFRENGRVYVQEAGSSEEAGLRVDPARGLSVASAATGTGLAGRITWTTSTIDRGAEQINWRSPTYGTAFGAGEGDQLVRRNESLLGTAKPRSVHIHRLDGDLTLCTGVVPVGDPLAEPGFAVEASTDHSTWQSVTGLPRSENDVAVGEASTVDGVHYLPVAEWIFPEDGGPSVLTPRLYSSTDGIAWEAVPPPVPDHPEPEKAALGAHVDVMTSVDGVLIGLGSVIDALDEWSPVTFVQDGEIWRTVPLDGAVRGDSIAGVGDDGVHGSVAGRTGRWSLTADGTLTETYRADDRGRRGPALDLGEGALLAGGWIDVPAGTEGDDGEVGIGACLWASLDGGESWQATMLPGQEGRFPDVHVRAQGDDVLVILDDPDVPHGYWIRGARADVLGEEGE